jgi:hypothetical protein
MVSGLSKIGVAAVAVVGVLALSPAAALADSCPAGTSSVSIYSECIPTASGGTHHSGGGHKPKTNSTPATPAPTVTVPQTIYVPQKVQKSIAHARHHKKMLKRLVTDPSLGATQAVVVPASYRAATPSALGAVFDLGSGPAALFAMLALAAIVLLGAGVVRGRRL